MRPLRWELTSNMLLETNLIEGVVDALGGSNQHFN
jgi:hypothetical protein